MPAVRSMYADPRPMEVILMVTHRELVVAIWEAIYLMRASWMEPDIMRAVVEVEGQLGPFTDRQWWAARNAVEATLRFKAGYEV